MIEDAIICPVCPKHCTLPNNTTGACRARKNIDSKSIPINYGKITSLALDPIEKKPISYYRSGSLLVSVGSFGCNLNCPFCQNHIIATSDEFHIPTKEISPEELVEFTKMQQAHNPSVIGIAYTYNEPLVGWEYVRDCARLARENNLVNVLVSNGCAEAGVIREIAPLMDAANIDLKTFNSDTYKLLGGDLKCVKNSISTLFNTPSLHLEITSLIVPGINDNLDELEEEFEWISSLSPYIPIHLNRFYPAYKMKDEKPTDIDFIYRAADIASKYLQYINIGNC